jgi:hypothetical protein
MRDKGEAVRVDRFNVKSETMVLLSEPEAQLHDLGMKRRIQTAVTSELERLEGGRDSELPASQATVEEKLSSVAESVQHLVRSFMQQYMLKCVFLPFSRCHLLKLTPPVVLSELPKATVPLPPATRQPLPQVAPDFEFTGEYTAALDGYLEIQSAKKNTDCVSDFTHPPLTHDLTLVVAARLRPPLPPRWRWNMSPSQCHRLSGSRVQ